MSSARPYGKTQDLIEYRLCCGCRQEHRDVTDTIRSEEQVHIRKALRVCLMAVAKG